MHQETISGKLLLTRMWYSCFPIRSGLIAKLKKKLKTSDKNVFNRFKLFLQHINKFILLMFLNFYYCGDINSSFVDTNSPSQNLNCDKAEEIAPHSSLFIKLWVNRLSFYYPLHGNVYLTSLLISTKPVPVQ